MSGLSFAKEEVRAPAPRSRPSALSVTLQQQQSASAGSGSGAPGSGASVPPTPATPRGDEAYTVAHVIRAVVAKFRQSGAAAAAAGALATAGAEPLGAHAAGYFLMVAGDDGNVDEDFPEVDAGVPISEVGVDKFVMCERGSELPVLRLCIPELALGQKHSHLLAAGDAMAAELSVSCTVPPALAAKTGGRPDEEPGAFLVVTLRPGGAVF
jgi:hypothetical protein